MPNRHLGVPSRHSAEQALRSAEQALVGRCAEQALRYWFAQRPLVDRSCESWPRVWLSTGPPNPFRFDTGPPNPRSILVRPTSF